MSPGEALHDEIELLVAAGVPRQRVLCAATADAWRYSGRPHEAGVIEVGARADLVLVAPLPASCSAARGCRAASSKRGYGRSHRSER
ncbi:MAG TPA: amidohydrolase family protein [Kofleriaceae bacterium]|nr:amidohydrolase family protein [Kofleriaceae bacterium]